MSLRLDERLKCSHVVIEYDNQDKRGDVWIKEGNSVDQDGAIQLFTMIDPGVKFIEVWNPPGKPGSVIYERKGRKWRQMKDQALYYMEAVGE